VSAGVGIWKEVLLKAVHSPARKAVVATPTVVTSSGAPQPVLSLVRQIFFPAAAVQRTHVLFAAADPGTRVAAICEQVGRALGELSGARVAVTEASSDAPLASRKRPGNVSGADGWRSYSSQIAENVWRVPSALMHGRAHSAGPDQGLSAGTGGLPFDYVLFAAVVTDAETPLYCGVCNGAVLVLTANQTRRESALRAREHLLQCNAELLETVLDGRTFPIPEAIYRRL